MSKLHELLAIEGSLKGQAEKVRKDLISTFSSKRHLFEEKLITYAPYTEAGGERRLESQSSLQSTVPQELAWASGFIVKQLDAALAVAEANTKARADIIFEDGSIIAKGLPATALLDLEKRLSEVKELLSAIPTLDPAKGFSADAARGSSIFKARDVKKVRTKKVQKPLVMAPATDKHPAQVQLITEDEPQGDILEQEWSAMLTPARKADLLLNCESLSRAVRQARSRANEQPLDQAAAKIGSSLLDFILA